MDEKIDLENSMGEYTQEIRNYVLKRSLFNLFISIPLMITIANAVGHLEYDSSEESKSLKNQNKQIKQELRITKGLVKKEVTTYDINNDGHEDYIFNNKDVYIYNPKKENYIETTISEIKKEKELELNALEKKIDILELNKQKRDSLICEKSFFLDKKTKLDSICDSLKK